MQNLFQDLADLLSNHPEYANDEGNLLKNSIVEHALALEPSLLKLLVGHEGLKQHFFEQVDGLLIFDKVQFQRFVMNKQFLPDSYTTFKNKIGLQTHEGEYLTESREVVLAWPYKDCVLEGGQTKDDARRNEVFYNETLAPDQIDRLLEPKAMRAWARYTETGKEAVSTIGLEDNLVLKGNNLLCLHSLLPVYRGKVKLIYIDPPYNTGSDSFGYNDSFNHSSWLTFMRNRLNVAKELLALDGCIFINADDSEAHYLKVLCDEDNLFGRDNFIGTAIWQKKYSTKADSKFYSESHDYLLTYAKKKGSFTLNGLPRTEKQNLSYKNLDNDPRGVWTSGDLLRTEYREYAYYPIISPTGIEHYPPKGSSWRFNKERIPELIEDNRIWFGFDGNSVPRLKRFLSEVQDELPSQTLWLHTDVGHSDEAKKEIGLLSSGVVFDTPKPERLLERVLHLGSKPGDIVLDFFAGSGTTAAVALKMGRRFIACEQMDYIRNIPMERLEKVIKGEQGGISTKYDWKGGGSFVYAELAQFNEAFALRIQEATTALEISEIYQDMQERAFLSYKLSPKAIDAAAVSLQDLTLTDQKRYLIEILDKNMLYVPYNEQEDATYGLTEADKQVNRTFYANAK